MNFYFVFVIEFIYLTIMTIVMKFGVKANIHTLGKKGRWSQFNKKWAIDIVGLNFLALSIGLVKNLFITNILFFYVNLITKVKKIRMKTSSKLCSLSFGAFMPFIPRNKDIFWWHKNRNKILLSHHWSFVGQCFPYPCKKFLKSE